MGNSENDMSAFSQTEEGAARTRPSLPFPLIQQSNPNQDGDISNLPLHSPLQGQEHFSATQSPGHHSQGSGGSSSKRHHGNDYLSNRSGSFESKKSHGSVRSSASQYSASRRRKLRLLQEFSWPDPLLYNHRSLYCMSLKNPLRRFCIACIEWKWWDRIVIFVILLNTVQLALYEPFDVPMYRPNAVRRDAFDLVGKVALREAVYLFLARVRVLSVCVRSRAVFLRDFCIEQKQKYDKKMHVISLLDSS